MRPWLSGRHAGKETALAESIAAGAHARLAAAVEARLRRSACCARCACCAVGGGPPPPPPPGRRRGEHADGGGPQDPGPDHEHRPGKAVLHGTAVGTAVVPRVPCYSPSAPRVGRKIKDLIESYWALSVGVETQRLTGWPPTTHAAPAVPAAGQLPRAHVQNVSAASSA